jgi:glucosamine-phosphate N-acetyltransferase
MLTSVGQMPKNDFEERFNYLKKHNHEYFTIVIEDTTKKLIVGAGTIFVERKFVHHNGLVGHIEDIVTHSEYRGFNLGRLVIETLKYIGEKAGCYKSNY